MRSYLVLLWLARLVGVAAIVPLMMAVFGEPGPTVAREWLYVALMPFAFSIGLLLGWRWPVLGGCVSLLALVASLVVAGRVYDWRAYLVWAALAVPAVVYVVAGLRLRWVARDDFRSSHSKTPRAIF